MSAVHASELLALSLAVEKKKRRNTNKLAVALAAFRWSLPDPSQPPQEMKSDRQFSWFTCIQIFFLVVYIFLSWAGCCQQTAREKLTNQTAAALAPGHLWCKLAVTRPSLATLLVATAADSCSSRLSFEENFATIEISCKLLTAVGGTRLRARRNVFKKLSRQQRVTARVKPLIGTLFPSRVEVVARHCADAKTQSSLLAQPFDATNGNSAPSYSHASYKLADGCHGSGRTGSVANELNHMTWSECPIRHNWIVYILRTKAIHKDWRSILFQKWKKQQQKKKNRILNFGQQEPPELVAKI